MPSDGINYSPGIYYAIFLGRMASCALSVCHCHGRPCLCDSLKRHLHCRRYRSRRNSRRLEQCLSQMTRTGGAGNSGGTPDPLPVAGLPFLVPDKRKKISPKFSHSSQSPRKPHSLLEFLLVKSQPWLARSCQGSLWGPIVGDWAV